MTEVEAVRARVVHYLAARRAIEAWALASMEKALAGPAGGPSPRLEAELDEAFARFRAEHLTAHAQVLVGGRIALGSPSVVDADHLEIVRINVEGRSASVHTLEDETAGALAPTPYEYTLAWERGDWRIDNRRTPRDVRRGSKWIDLLV